MSVCRYLATIREKQRSPDQVSPDNVCYASGTEYWEYGLVDPVLQKRICFSDGHPKCPRYIKAIAAQTPLPSGAAPGTQPPRARPWWKFWGS